MTSGGQLLRSVSSSVEGERCERSGLSEVYRLKQTCGHGVPEHGEGGAGAGALRHPLVRHCLEGGGREGRQHVLLVPAHRGAAARLRGNGLRLRPIGQGAQVVSSLGK